MPNDVSYFKVPGDSNTYAFNDADAESGLAAETERATAAEQANADAISAEASRAADVEGTLSDLTTTAKGSLVAAINEVDANTDANTASIANLTGTSIGVSEAVFKDGVALTSESFSNFEYVDLYLSAQGHRLPCLRIFPHKTDGLTYGIYASYFNTSDSYIRILSGAFVTSGRYLSTFKLAMSNATVGSAPGSWSDISSSNLLTVMRIIGYK